MELLASCHEYTNSYAREFAMSLDLSGLPLITVAAAILVIGGFGLFVYVAFFSSGRRNTTNPSRDDDDEEE